MILSDFETWKQVFFFDLPVYFLKGSEYGHE